MIQLIRKLVASRYVRLVLIGLVPGMTVYGTLKLWVPKDDSNIDAVPGLYIKERRVDLGNLTPDEVVDASFELANHGNKPITLEHTQSICGCGTVGDAEGVILPDKALRFSIRFDAAHSLPTRFDKPVLCKFSSPVAADVHLHIVGTINRSFWLTAFPDTLDFRKVELGSRSEHTLYLFGGNDILGAIPDEIVVGQAHPTFTLDIPKLPTPVVSKRVHVVLSPELTRSPGTLATFIDFFAAGQQHRRTTVRVSADIFPKPSLNKEK